MPIARDVSSAPSIPIPTEAEDTNMLRQEVKLGELGRRVAEKESLSSSNFDMPTTALPSSNSFHARETVTSASFDKEQPEMRSTHSDPTGRKIPMYAQRNLNDIEEKVQKVSPPRRKSTRDEKSEKSGSWQKKDNVVPDVSTASSKQYGPGISNTNDTGFRKSEPEPTPDGNINAILEVRTLNIRLCVRMFFHFYFSTYAASIFSHQESSFVFHHVKENNCTTSPTSSVVF